MTAASAVSAGCGLAGSLYFSRDFFGLPGAYVLGVLVCFVLGLGAQAGFVPVTGHFVDNFDLGLRDVCSLVGVGIDHRQRDFGHAVGLAVARAGEDHIFHARSAKGFGGLLAQHPGDSVGDIGFAASVGADDARDAFALELQFRAVTERLEAKDL